MRLSVNFYAWICTIWGSTLLLNAVTKNIKLVDNVKFCSCYCKFSLAMQFAYYTFLEHEVYETMVMPITTNNRGSRHREVSN